MRNITRHLLVSSNLAGNLDALNQLITVARESNVDAILLTGNLTAKQDGVKGYRELFKMLAHANLPSFYIPGPNDFPVQPYLFETASIEVVFPYLHGVHSTFAFAPGHILVCGMEVKSSTPQKPNGRKNRPFATLAGKPSTGLNFFRRCGTIPKFSSSPRRPLTKASVRPAAKV